MSIWSKLFGRSGSPGTVAPQPIGATPPPPVKSTREIPWDYIQKASKENDDFFAMHKAALPSIFKSVLSCGVDPILMLVSFEQEKWCALLALLYKRPEKMLLMPEQFTGTTPEISNNGFCDVYVPPSIKGNAMQSAVFVLERDWLASELAWVKDIPPIFIQMVRDKLFHPDGTFTIAVFAPRGMRVEHLPLP
jgi:hypothetical protein